MLVVIRLSVHADATLWDTNGHPATIAEGQHWYVIGDEDCRYPPFFDAALARNAAIRRDVSLFYFDESIDSAPCCGPKPEFDLARLTAEDYVGVPIAIQADALAQLGSIRPQHGEAAIYDLLLRAAAAGMVIDRAADTEVRRSRARTTAPQALRERAVQSWAEAAGHALDVLPDPVRSALQLRVRFNAGIPPPPLTIAIAHHDAPKAPGRDDAHWLQALLAGLSSPADLDQPLRVIAHEAAARGVVGPGFGSVPVRIIGSASNYPSVTAQFNTLWRNCETEHLVLIANAYPSSADWPWWALLSFSLQQDVGIVNALVADAAGNIEGAVSREQLRDAYADASTPSVRPQPLDALKRFHCEWPIGASRVLAIRRSVLEEVQGLDEGLPLLLSTLDLNLKLRMLGYRSVTTPHAPFTAPSALAGEPLAPSAVAIFFARWQEILARRNWL
ncbi:hypothetical protein [Xenophilus azovorans]|uniref:hypothetical protein n=1 Tax=Xenophilus azovorans TaxID=151755 RepID=UPI00056FD5E0|nr:hypothetical protein [Xenophilus azovorans]